MNKMTIQQAIFLLATLTEKEKSLSMNLHSYRVPLAVNGKDVTDSKKAKQMLEELQKLDAIQKDIFTLKTKLAKTNVETIFENKVLNEFLEEVRIKRAYLTTLKTLLSTNSTRVESSIGVVQYGVLNDEYVKEKAQTLEKEVFELSQKIDSINASTYIEIELLNNN